MFRYAYLHGFGSNPRAKKALELRARLAPGGVTLLAPDLNVPSFEHLSPSAMLARLDQLDAELGGHERWRLIGSSMGGWLAARWAELRPERVDSLVLLCPAFDFAALWPQLLPEGALQRWRQKGWLMLPDADQRMHPVHWAFYEESCEAITRPRACVPTTVVHGVRDERVPIDSSRRWVAANSGTELIEVDDVHSLERSIDAVEGAARARFGLG
jgi:uncharacterized protein